MHIEPKSGIICAESNERRKRGNFYIMLETVAENKITANAGYAIVAEGLVKNYAKLRAVDGVDLRIPTGQIYALLGPNGAGKTTTFNMLTTLSRPDGGRATVAGYDVTTQADEVRFRIGVTFQEMVTDKQLTGRQLLAVHGRLYGMDKKQIAGRTEELAALVELTEWFDTPVRELSGGMKRRLELIRGLLTEPQVLFLDEPTVGLDPQNRVALWKYIRKLRRENGLTVLFSTHYMEEAEKVADTVGIMDGGKLIAQGTPAELISTIGGEFLRLTGAGDYANFAQKLRNQSWLTSLDLEQNADDSATLQIGVQGEAGKAVKPALDLAESAGFRVADVATDKPNLNDVFLKLTGKRLRD
jgi:ABC-2 type transport system ATP-binding protein